MTLTTYQCRPESKGSIHAKTSNPNDAPAIRPNFLADPMDRRVLVEGMKIGRRIIGNAVLDKYRAHEMNPGDKISMTMHPMKDGSKYGLTASSSRVKVPRGISAILGSSRTNTRSKLSTTRSMTRHSSTRR